MPELPEVQTVLTTLQPRLLGLRIEQVEVFLEKIIKAPHPREFVALLRGRSITGLRRRGKYLLLELDGSHLLAVHLRMTGRLVYSSPEKPRDKHVHLVFYLNNGDELRFQDMRQFGTMNLMPVASFEAFCSQKGLGPDALDPALTGDLFEKRFQGRRGQIKKLLLDQSPVAGIGNIYANEILWRVRIHPERTIASLTPVDMEGLYRAMRSVLEDGSSRPGHHAAGLRRWRRKSGQLSVTVGCSRTGGRAMSQVWKRDHQAEDRWAQFFCLPRLPASNEAKRSLKAMCLFAKGEGY